MPRILPARSRTSARDFATLTPPPLPRPPAWICALTTQTDPSSVSAAFTASSTENAGMPRGVAIHLAPQSGESLSRRGGRLRQQLRNVTASAHTAHRSIKRFAKTVQQVDADEGRIRRRDFIAGDRKSHPL